MTLFFCYSEKMEIIKRELLQDFSSAFFYFPTNMPLFSSFSSALWVLCPWVHVLSHDQRLYLCTRPTSFAQGPAPDISPRPHSCTTIFSLCLWPLPSANKWSIPLPDTASGTPGCTKMNKQVPQVSLFLFVWTETKELSVPSVGWWVVSPAPCGATR